MATAKTGTRSRAKGTTGGNGSPSATAPLYEKFQQFERKLKAPLVERDEEAFLLTLCALAREHMAQIGGAGIAKSMLAERATALIEGARIFELQFFKGTVPEEVFGPISPKALLEDTFRRKIEGYLPDCEIAFLDEWWKANSMILNGTLGVMLERKYKNNGHQIVCPLVTGFICSNELPERSQVELAAIRDRILVTKVVQGVRAADSFRTMLDGYLERASGQATGLMDDEPVVTMDELREAHKQVDAILVPPDVKAAVETLWADCSANDLQVSDRRILKCVGVGKAKAWLAGRKEMLPDDLTVFQHMLWIDPEDIPTAHAVTLNFASEFERKAARFRQEYEDVLPEMGQIRTMLAQDPVDFTSMTPVAAKAHATLKGILGKVKEQREKADEAGRDTRAIDELAREIGDAREFIRQEALGMDE